MAGQPTAARMTHVHCILIAWRRAGTVRMARHILAELGAGRLTAELLTPNELVSGLLLQVGERGCP